MSIVQGDLDIGRKTARYAASTPYFLHIVLLANHITLSQNITCIEYCARQCSEYCTGRLGYWSLDSWTTRYAVSDTAAQTVDRIFLVASQIMCKHMTYFLLVLG